MINEFPNFITGGIYPHQMPVQQFQQQNMNAFTQNSFPNQHVSQQFQMGMPATNQIPQMCMNSQMGAMGTNQMAMGHVNGQVNSAMTMQAQMVNKYKLTFLMNKFE